VALSEDHKPQNPIELKRIEAAGGEVKNNRVNGILALSRALGDFRFKNNANLPPEAQAVTAEPDVTVHTRNGEKDEFMVVACDGIWDVLDNSQVIDFIRPRLQEAVGFPVKGRSSFSPDVIAKIAEDLLEECCAKEFVPPGLGTDNMTVIIVAFTTDGVPVITTKITPKAIEPRSPTIIPPPPSKS